MIKVLLVDDEFHVISHLTNLLQQMEQYELNIVSTCSGPEALSLIASSHIDIAFLDINMPKVGGLMIADKLHRQWPDCQIVFLTAYEVFDYIYEANQYPGAVYLLKAEPDKKLRSVAEASCETILRKREEKEYLTDIQQKQKQLLLLQEQLLLREVLHGNLSGNLIDFVQSAALEIHFSLQDKVYLMLMDIKKAPSACLESVFYLDRMERLLGNLFCFSFVETQKGMLLWIFQEKAGLEQELSCFDCLKDTMDAFLDICTDIRHQTVSLCLYREKVDWEQLQGAYQLLYDAYYRESALLSMNASAARVIEALAPALEPEPSALSASAVLPKKLVSMKQALYQGNRDLFLTELLYCRQYCVSVRSRHHTGAVKLYFSLAVIYLDYIEHYGLEQRLSMEIALYPLYCINDFADWNQAFVYLKRLAEALFCIAGEFSNDKTTQLISSIQNYVQGHLSEDLSLTVIANYVNYNESHVSRLYKRVTGDKLTDYITACRITYARQLLAQTEDTVQVISQKAGFHTSQYFSSSFRKSTGMSPNEYRQQSRGGACTV
nr:helix-turn-helix domain-containing protein [uncultured Acetatifactor sp.]